VAVTALEASLMPVLVLVRQILRVGSNGGLAVFTAVGKQRLVALDAEGLLIAQDVAIASQVEVAVEA